jgi:endonuclease/exonuclease/phosphatase family metal-dependent hydrolase
MEGLPGGSRITYQDVAMANNYTGLRQLKRSDPTAAQRCAARLRDIRANLSNLRQRKREGSLLLATWNIRDFDSNKFGYGHRLPETFFYIAEIISCFDLVAMQEVNRDLSALDRVLDILGPKWDYIATDTTEGSGGNQERMAFVYNTDKVRFRRIAGEVVLPDGQLIVSRKRTAAEEPTLDAGAVEEAADIGFEEVRQQFARTPFVVAFQAGWFRFNLCTVHIYFGDDSGDRLKRRIAEIQQLVAFFAKRQDKENTGGRNDPARMENYILLGDFNVVSPEHETMKALKAKGFTVPAGIDGDEVRGPEDHFYDQIAVRVKDPRFKVAGGGMVDMFARVFRDTDDDFEIYQDRLPERPRAEDDDPAPDSPRDLYRKWRTWQMSDHRPLWIEVETDYTEHYLDQFATPEP